MESSVLVEKEPLIGDWAWLGLIIGIFSYDMFALKSKKCETMSAAIIRSLAHPIKGPTAVLAWVTVTHHLFGNKRARRCYVDQISNVKSKRTSE
jgi:hypothetical protein